MTLPELSLAWLLAPVLLAPWVAPVGRLGSAAARVVAGGLVLGALVAGTGDTTLAHLLAWGAREGNGAFLVATLGILGTGALVPWEAPRRAAAWLPSLPGGIALAALLVPLWLPGPWLAGTAAGLLPRVAAAVRRRMAGGGSVRPAPIPPPTALGPAARLALAALVAVAVAGGPVAAVAGGLAVLLALAAHGARHLGGGRRFLAPAIAAAGLAGYAWLALTVAGSPVVALRAFAGRAPLSPAAEALLATFLVVALLGAFAPWPLHRLGDARATFPLAVAFAHAAAVMGVPDAIRDWHPLLGMVLVPVAAIAVARRAWDGAAGALAFLAAIRPGTLALASALAVILWPAALALRPAGRGNPHPGERVTFPGVRLGVTAAAAGAAGTVATLMGDEVLLGTLLAAGLAVAATLTDRDPPVPAAARPGATP